MKMIDALGKPCPIPVMEAKKALAEQGINGVFIKVDNIAAVQNLEKMANGYGHLFSYVGNAADSYEVEIRKSGKDSSEEKTSETNVLRNGESSNGMTIVIGGDSMGQGAEELGKILIKGFIYSLTELPTPPKYVIFFNSGARLSSDGANTIDDLKKLTEKGTEILTCGTCVNYYELQDKLAVGKIVNMYEITEILASSNSIVNI